MCINVAYFIYILPKIGGGGGGAKAPSAPPLLPVYCTYDLEKGTDYFSGLGILKIPFPPLSYTMKY